jgi:hypothetical protein
MPIPDILKEGAVRGEESWRRSNRNRMESQPEQIKVSKAARVMQKRCNGKRAREHSDCLQEERRWEHT